MDEINQNYYCFRFNSIPDDIQLARLYELGFDSFEEKETTMDGYLGESKLNDDILVAIKEIAEYTDYELIKQQNWNAIWESGFNPINVDNKIFIRASFHAPVDIPYEIIIDPKMAFGTGHHATTYMVLSEMLKAEMDNATVLDFGSGSGILAIGAQKLGAKSIDAIDYDIWSVENTKENAVLNDCDRINVWQADNLKELDQTYDIILANITRDILLTNSNDIWRLLNQNGIAIYSGFIPADVFKIKSYLNGLGVTKLKLISRENWACLVWAKS